ncbi:hypothetical protein H4R18_001079 [Coemansia javaensis]|uniref:Uncharacterized protein n=1 Tax=Coemansia javaensis TaxID=2761396 RepID=A0A9W8HI54_9FUNG|nr:hypothetical protein H4R18_001079 [Coemansia javaensis]
MGQSGSRAAAAGTARRVLPRGQGAAGEAARQGETARRAATREEMLAEEGEGQEGDGRDKALDDRLRYFVNPRELRTPITPASPAENAGFRAVTNRQGAAPRAATSAEIAQMLRDLHAARQGGQAAAAAAAERAAAARYGLDAATVQRLSRFLDPVGDRRG